MKYYGITDKGLVRKNNQDSYVIATNEANDIFAIVADGIGGNFGGDIASRMTVRFFSKVFSETEQFTSEEEARKSLQLSTHVIYKYLNMDRHMRI